MQRAYKMEKFPSTSRRKFLAIVSTTTLATTLPYSILSKNIYSGSGTPSENEKILPGYNWQVGVSRKGITPKTKIWLASLEMGRRCERTNWESCTEGRVWIGITCRRIIYQLSERWRMFDPNLMNNFRIIRKIKNMFLISPIIIVSVISFSCYSQSTNKTTVDQGLAGYWKLFEDLLDHSRNNLLT